MLFKSKKSTFSISIARGVLDAIFDECDRYDIDETGGRLIGTYRHDGGHYAIKVKGVLEAGPKATRSPTSFFQDGEYQEKVFRSIEADHPEIEHLGTWHTHHVNGYPTLSGGDKTTYFKTVNHELHNIDFFYALLVVRKNNGGDPRYTVKHFVFRRDDDTIYEIPAKEVRIVEARALAADGGLVKPIESPRPGGGNPERSKDREFFSEFYPALRPLLSKTSGTPYWKGPLILVDGSEAEVVAIENVEGGSPHYSIGSSFKNRLILDLLAEYGERQFSSARQAVVHFERDINRALYLGKKA